MIIFNVLVAKDANDWDRMYRMARKCNVIIIECRDKAIRDSFGNAIGNVMAYKCKGSLIGALRMLLKTSKSIYSHNGEIYLW